jgi:hypothetical protein
MFMAEDQTPIPPNVQLYGVKCSVRTLYPIAPVLEVLSDYETGQEMEKIKGYPATGPGI